jgi:hypothetical protein
MIENMVAVLVTEPELFQSPRLLEECRTFVRRVDGNAAAADGAHDDCVMAMAIALVVRKEDAGRGIRRPGVEMTSLDMATREEILPRPVGGAREQSSFVTKKI